nr:unnamed protein product [Callosobruchus analis]
MEHRRNNKLIISKGHLRRLVNREVLRHRLRSEAASNSCTVHIESEGNYPPTQIEPEAMPWQTFAPRHEYDLKLPDKPSFAPSGTCKMSLSLFLK